MRTSLWLLIGLIGNCYLQGQPARHDQTPILFIRWFNADSSAVMLWDWSGQPRPLLYRKGPYWWAKWNARGDKVAIVRGRRPHTELLIAQWDSLHKQFRSVQVFFRGDTSGFIYDIDWHPFADMLAVEWWYPADTDQALLVNNYLFLPDIWVVNLKTRKIIARFGERLKIEYQPRWSPDGKRILFISNRHSPDTSFLPIFDLFLIPVRDTALPQQLTRHAHAIKTPLWLSPHQILYYSQGLPDGMGIYLHDLRTGRDSLLIPYGFAPSLSPTGRYIAYINQRLDLQARIDSFGLWIYDTRTGEHWRLTDDRDLYPAWQPRIHFWRKNN